MSSLDLLFNPNYWCENDFICPLASLLQDSIIYHALIMKFQSKRLNMSQRITFEFALTLLAPSSFPFCLFASILRLASKSFVNSFSRFWLPLTLFLLSILLVLCCCRPVLLFESLVRFESLLNPLTISNFLTCPCALAFECLLFDLFEVIVLLMVTLGVLCELVKIVKSPSLFRLILTLPRFISSNPSSLAS